ncbi:MAG: hypothetical protein KDA85_01835 [Planctomycetaceae bacterium]|nr:hypothetical protein [Planctomycetaceae bacterium]
MSAVMLAAVSVGVADETKPAQQVEIAKGRIVGRLVDASGQPRTVPHVFVFICRDDNGMPLVSADGDVLGQKRVSGGLDALLHAETDAEGRFEIPAIAEGTYRLIAQSWEGLQTVQVWKGEDAPLMLHGVSGAVEVKEHETAEAMIRPLGNASVTVNNTPDEGNAFLFVSLQPAMGEPVLGPLMWGTKFIRGVVGATHMKRGTQVIRGLPEDADVYVRLMNYDNNPGVGGVEFHSGKQHVVELPVYATWSNGYHTPPERLNALVEWLRNHRDQLPALLSSDDPAKILLANGEIDHRKVFEHVKEHAEERVTVEGIGEFRLIDVLAADVYLRTLEFHEARRAKQ